MVYLKKEDIFFERDENGKLLPVEVTLETLEDKPQIKAIPLTKGQLAKIVSDTKGTDTNVDTDIDIVISNCVEPKFTEEDREKLKTSGKAMMVNAIAIAIFSISTNTSQTELLNQGKKLLAKKELEDFQNQ